PVLFLANLFLGIYYNLSIGVKLSDRTYYRSWMSIFGAIVTITLYIILIPIIGYAARALVTLISNVSVCQTSFYLGHKFYPILYTSIRSIIYIIGTVVFTYAIMSIKIDDLILSISFHSIAVLAFVGGVYILEKRNIKYKTG